MNYHNQLVLTGEINNDGAYIRKNTGKSYRTGVELSGGFRMNSHVKLDGNISLMTSKTNYSAENSDGGITEFEHVDISFSPACCGRRAAPAVSCQKPGMRLAVQICGKAISRQYRK